MSGSNGTGKGDRYRQVNTKQYYENYDKIFGIKDNKARSRPITKSVNKKRKKQNGNSENG